MARKLRVRFEGAIYHVTLRGVERRPIFTEDRERERFLDRLADGVETHDVRLYLFCLMPNHAHLVVETPRANIDRFMQGLETAYTVYFNLRHGRCGHLMQGRYGAVLVEGNEYLLALSRYVHLNPVHVGRAKQLSLLERVDLLRGYRWSSYRSYVGKAKPLEFVDYGPVLAMTAADEARQPHAYRCYIEAGIADTDEEFLEIKKRSTLSIGSESFHARVRDAHLDLIRQQRRPEDASFRRMGGVVPVPDILKALCEELGTDAEGLRRHRKGSHVRPIAAKALCRYGGLTQREAAEVLGLGTGAAVSVQLKWLKRAAETSEETKLLLTRLDARLATRGK